MNDMEKITISIFSADLEYGNALGKAISNIHKNFLVNVKHLEEDELEVGYLILQIIGNEQKILLSEIPVEFEPDKMPKEIYKYQRVSEISKEISYIIAMITGKYWSPFQQEKTKLIGFYSGTSGCGKTSLAIGVGRQLSRYENLKVLYLSLEDIESTGVYFPSEASFNRRNMGTYIYYTFYGEKQSMATLPSSFIRTDSYGVDFFNPCKSKNEIRTLHCDELYKLLGNIMKYSDYQYIILDFQSDLSEETTYLMTCCERVVLIQEETPLSKLRTEKFLTYICQEEKHFSEENFLYVKNKIRQFNSCEGGQAQQLDCEEKVRESTIYVPWDEESFTREDKHINISVENTFGLGVQGIVAKIREGKDNKLQSY